MNELEKYYNKFNEDKRLLSRHGQVEFEVANHYIDKIIGDKKNLKIIDIGAGTGRYSDRLAKLGHEVTAIDLVNKNVSQIKLKNSNIVAKQGNALKLKFEDESFDMALLFGPEYHLISHDEKLKALNEAKRVVKKGGYILVMYLMNEYAVITYAFKEGNLKKVLEDGKLDNEFQCQTTKDDLYSYVRLEEINRLVAEANLSREKIVAIDGATDYIRSVINAMSEEDFEIYKKYILSIAERPELLGASSHCLDILVK